MSGFELHPQLEADSRHIAQLGLCDLRLLADKRWPWLLLIPQRADIVEIIDLTPLDQTMLTFEVDLVARALKDITNCMRINVGALGNKVPQFHMHVVAREVSDPAWPGPVWGHGTMVPYSTEEELALIKSLLDAI